MSKDRWKPIEQIVLFKERVDELKTTRLVSNGFNITSKICWDKENGLKIIPPNIDTDDLRSFLTVFRHFISNDEPTYLFSIFNICYQYLSDEKTKVFLTELRKKWKSTLEKNGIKFKLNNKEYKPEELMSLWINGWSHHNDKSHRSLLKSLIPHEENIMRIVFLDALVESSRVILHLYKIINYAENNNYVKEMEI